MDKKISIPIKIFVFFIFLSFLVFSDTIITDERIDVPNVNSTLGNFTNQLWVNNNLVNEWLYNTSLGINGTNVLLNSLEVTKNIVASGNTTAENVFLPSYVSSHTDDTILVVVGGSWYNITFDEEEDEFKKRITHNPNDNTNTTFIIQDTGVYEITYTMSFEDSVAVPNSHIVTRILRNNIELNGFTIETDLGIQNRDESLHHSDLIELTENDEIVLQFTSDDTTVSLSSHLTYGVHKNTGHLTIKRIA